MKGVFTMKTLDALNPMPYIVPYKTQKRLALLCLFTYLLSCIDFLFTYTYLKTGCFYEINPFMHPIITTPFYIIPIKIIFPAFLMYMVFTKLCHSDKHLVLLGQIFLSLTTFFYFALDCFHVYLLSYIS